MSDTAALIVTDRALAKVLEIRHQEPDAAELALGIRITGVQGAEFRYELAMVRVDDLDPDDHVEKHGELTVFVPADSVENLTGATLDLSRDLLNPGLTIDNPNSPSPKIEPGLATELTGPVAERVKQVLDLQINPAIASHGGMAELVAVEGGTAYLRLGGGCQGCGMAQVTLSQGIEQAIKTAVPEITTIMDVTDHASGQNPFYEAAKK